MNTFVAVVLACVSASVGRHVEVPLRKTPVAATVKRSHNTAQRPFVGYLDPTASPYWLDPDGLEANLPPELSPDHLAMLPKKCKISVGTCDGSVLYRSASGRCNNLIHPEYGTSGQLLYRLLSPVYDRGMMRTASVLGGLLPNPRLVSLLVHRVPHLPSHPSQPTIFSAPQHNVMVMQMGQFIDHDYSITSVFKDAHGKKICNSCTSWQAPWCAPIPLPKYDPFIPSLDDKGQRRCLPVTRSVAKFEEDYRGRKTLQQHNLNTAFLDLSLIYGNDLCVQKNLRLFSGGLLSSSENERLLLKESHNFPDCRTHDKLCAASGDPRPNENPGLALLHMVFHREHNRLAKSLQAINTHWDDEKLFQEARRINIAQHQHCTSLEYVPVIVGYDMAARHKLLPQQNGFFMGYNESRNPSILNEFSTAAFRMGHSSIPDTLQLLDPHYKLLSSVPMVSSFHNVTSLISPGPADPLLRGLLGSVMLPIDLRLADSIMNELFQKTNLPHSGQDLFALNLARGRDHGLAPYVKYVFYCGVGEVKDFSDLRSLMPIRAVAALRQAYRHVHDIDLYVGGLAENHLPGATVGPTFACIITLQFKITKTSDRFWYESLGSGFTYSQLQSIRTITLSSVLCKNMDEKNPKVPANAYQVPNEKSNPLHRCHLLPATDLSLWKEPDQVFTRPCHHLGVPYPPLTTIPVSPCLICICQPDAQIKCQYDVSECRFPTRWDDYCKKICVGRLQGNSRL